MKKNVKQLSKVVVIKKIKSFFVGEGKEIKLLSLLFLGGLLVIGTLALSSSKRTFFKEKILGEVPVVTVDCQLRSELNGVCVNDTLEKTPVIVGVMIENHADSRPQAGLAEADIVYEAMVEGNYTRFLAMYPQTAQVKKIGPVRSSRPYYLDWVAEYGNPLYMHVGGSPDALALIGKRGVWDANEMYLGNSFWRATNRLAPHNTYTSNDLWSKLIDNKTKNVFSGWGFATSSVDCVTRCVDFIEISYLRPSFVTGWKFNSSTQNFERWQNGAPHQTETGNIYADTVAIMESPVKVLDSVGRLEMKTIGRGSAVVVVRGQKIVGTWQKTGLRERTLFFDQQGKEIIFAPGKIWVQVVPRLEVVNFTEL